MRRSSSNSSVKLVRKLDFIWTAGQINICLSSRRYTRRRAVRVFRTKRRFQEDENDRSRCGCRLVRPRQRKRFRSRSLHHVQRSLHGREGRVPGHNICSRSEQYSASKRCSRQRLRHVDLPTSSESSRRPGQEHHHQRNSGRHLGCRSP